jgi:hypothetical protein
MHPTGGWLTCAATAWRRFLSSAGYPTQKPGLTFHFTGISGSSVHYRERGEQYWQLGDQTYHMEGGDLFVE